LPTDIEVHYFIRDRNPDKRTWLVERLLAEAAARSAKIAQKVHEGLSGQSCVSCHQSPHGWASEKELKQLKGQENALKKAQEEMLKAYERELKAAESKAKLDATLEKALKYLQEKQAKQKAPDKMAPQRDPHLLAGELIQQYLKQSQMAKPKTEDSKAAPGQQSKSLLEELNKYLSIEKAPQKPAENKKPSEPAKVSPHQVWPLSEQNAQTERALRMLIDRLIEENLIQPKKAETKPAEATKEQKQEPSVLFSGSFSASNITSSSLLAPELQALQGIWQVTNLLQGGNRKAFPNGPEALRLVIQGDGVTHYRGNKQIAISRLTLKSGKLTLELVQGPQPGKTETYSYELKGDRLWVGPVAAHREPLIAEFWAAPRSEQMILELRRIRPAEKPAAGN
jgi:uncharacterized protein (TIGR03067 family)